MNLRTEISIPKSESLINYHQNIVTLGSCFAENIGRRLHDHGLTCSPSLYGTLYNPVSILKSINWSLDDFQLNSDHIISDESIYKSLDFHSDLRSSNEASFLTKAKELHESSRQTLVNANTLIITLGSAWVYKYKNELIANCHKQPSSIFTEELLSVQEVANSISEIIQRLNHIENIIITLSPVRHMNYGLSDNNLSKSILRTAINTIVNEHSHVSYFPAYEAVIDDLRDYRFYKEDLVHPTDLAITYIYDHFVKTYLVDSQIPVHNEVSRIQKTLSHRAINPESEQHKKSLRRLKNKIEDLPSFVNKEKLTDTLRRKQVIQEE